MDSQTWQAGYDHCPRIVQDYLLDATSGDNEDAAQQELALDNDAWDRVSDPAWRLVFDGMTKEMFRREIEQVAGDQDPNVIERVLLKNIVLPLADLVAWDVEARLQELGIPLATLQSSFRISLRPMSYGAAARRVAINAKLSVLTEEVARRLREILVSYIKGVRTVEQAKQALQLTQQEGGLGFSREQADAYVDELIKLQLAVQILSEQEYADWYARFQRDASVKLMQKNAAAKAGAQAAATLGPNGAPVSAGAATQNAEDTDTLPIVRASSDPYDALLERTIEETLAQLSVAGLDEYLTKRLRNIISTRLRDVRNAVQVKEVLTRDSKIGGLDRHPEEADAMVTMIEQAYQAHRAELGAAEQQRMEQMKRAQEQKRDERRKEESAAHAEWYRAKVQATNPWAAALAGQPLPGTAAFTQQPVASTAQQPGQVTWPLSSPQNVGGGLDPLRPTVDSIRPPTRLTSLANEMGRMTLVEFRRIAKKPEEAMERLWQKLETLKQESYEQWSEGAQAWRQSPLQQQYLQLVAQSFTQGRPVADLAREKHEQDPAQLSAEEIGSIMLLNNRLNV